MNFNDLTVTISKDFSVDKFQVYVDAIKALVKTDNCFDELLVDYGIITEEGGLHPDLLSVYIENGELKWGLDISRIEALYLELEEDFNNDRKERQHPHTKTSSFGCSYSFSRNSALSYYISHY